MQNVKVEKKVTLDIDAHLVETDKAQARRCYQGIQGLPADRGVLGGDGPGAG